MDKILNPWYITGFADGEAAFTYSRVGGSFGLYFAIHQREDNKQLIEAIQSFFSYVGRIYHKKEALPTVNSGYTKAAAYYRVTKISELQVIVGHFDKYPLQSQKKLEAYKVWREMVMHKLENYRSVDYNKLHQLAEKLSSLNLKSRAFKVHKK
jgi:hypothetical protein